MPDREKVVRGLETCSNADEVGCDQCPYYGAQGERGCQSTMQMDALALLREQEPVEPKWTGFEDSFTGEKYKVYQCGNCGSYLLSDALYCPMCGRAVKWSD